MRVLAIACVVGLLWTGTATASPIGIELISGGTEQAISVFTGSVLNAFGDDFAMTVRLPGGAGFFFPAPPYAADTSIFVHAGWSGIDAPGTFTFQGVTYALGTFNGPGVVLDFRSDPFVVPPINGSPVSFVPFTLTGSINGVPDIGRVDLHGTGTMEFTFAAPFTGATAPNGGWFGGSADFTIEQTPEPSAIITLAAALGGLGVMSRRRFRSWVGADTSEGKETTESD